MVSAFRSLRLMWGLSADSEHSITYQLAEGLSLNCLTFTTPRNESISHITQKHLGLIAETFRLWLLLIALLSGEIFFFQSIVRTHLLVTASWLVFYFQIIFSDFPFKLQLFVNQFNDFFLFNNSAKFWWQTFILFSNFFGNSLLSLFSTVHAFRRFHAFKTYQADLLIRRRFITNWHDRWEDLFVQEIQQVLPVWR